VGYRISYEHGERKISQTNRSVVKFKLKRKWIVCTVLIFLFVGLLYNKSFRRLCLPGNGAVTETAIIKLVDSLRNGEPAGKSVAAFCRFIIENAD
jgi:hypothetical protein